MAFCSKHLLLLRKGLCTALWERWLLSSLSVAEAGLGPPQMDGMGQAEHPDGRTENTPQAMRREAGGSLRQFCKLSAA